MANLDLEIQSIEVEYIAPHIKSGTTRIELYLAVVRGARGKKRLLGEAFTRTIYQPLIQFKVFDEENVDSLFAKFLQQLIHRGYQPIQYRTRDLDDRLSEWKPCDLAMLDKTDLERAEKDGMDIGESFDDF